MSDKLALFITIYMIISLIFAIVLTISYSDFELIKSTEENVKEDCENLNILGNIICIFSLIVMIPMLLMYIICCSIPKSIDIIIDLFNKYCKK